MSFGPTFGAAMAELGGFKLPFWAVGAAFVVTVIAMALFKSEPTEESKDMR